MVARSCAMGYSEHRVHEPGVEGLAGEPLRRRPGWWLADPTAMTPGASSGTSPPRRGASRGPCGCRGSAGARCRSARSAGSRGCGPASPATSRPPGPRTHAGVAGEKSRFGSGSTRKSSLASREVTSRPPRTSSLRMPAVRVAGQLLGRGLAQEPGEVAPQRVAGCRPARPVVMAWLRASSSCSVSVSSSVRWEHPRRRGPGAAGRTRRLVLGAGDPRDAVEAACRCCGVSRFQPFPGRWSHDGLGADLAVGAVGGHGPHPRHLAVSSSYAP